jgi:hypothetical protein
MKSHVKKFTIIFLTVFLVFGVLQLPAYGKNENGKEEKVKEEKAKPFVLEEATVRASKPHSRIKR